MPSRGMTCLTAGGHLEQVDYTQGHPEAIFHLFADLAAATARSDGNRPVTHVASDFTAERARAALCATDALCQSSRRA